jgi:DNA-binding response OmpR family regulator
MSENKKRILVVDDDEDIADMMEMILENQGYSVNTIIRAEEVLGIKEDLPNLILLDIWMSGVDGRDICRHLKNQPLTKHIPIILISANRDIEEIAKTAGANDFICKPFDMDELLEKVEKYCN